MDKCRVCNGVIMIQIRKGTGLCSIRCEKREAANREEAEA